MGEYVPKQLLLSNIELNALRFQCVYGKDKGKERKLGRDLFVVNDLFLYEINAINIMWVANQSITRIKFANQECGPFFFYVMLPIVYSHNEKILYSGSYNGGAW